MDALQLGREFLPVLDRAKARAKADFEWYRYHSLTNLSHVSDFLTDNVLQLAREKGVLDLGCGDGDLSFFFESLGCQVTALDHPGPNHNGMRGVRLLKQTLGSRIEVREADLDSNFPRLERRYGVALLLGVLYHLKNPFYVLENVARSAEICIMSTRIARKFPEIGRLPGGAACAYLLDPDELNQDESNFWIFSEAGLTRLLKRTWWTILAERGAGDIVDSDATSLDHDERKFCLLRSRFGLAEVELLSGWHAAEPAGWRWTEREFSLQASGGKTMTMELYVPPELLAQVGPVRMEMSAGAVSLAPAVLEMPGIQTLTRSIGGSGVVRFRLDKVLPPRPEDARELGLIVWNVTFS